MPGPPGAVIASTRSVIAASSVVWLLVLVVAVVAVPARATHGAQVSADEPQYLLTALSLASDGDLDISDEIAAEQFRDFHEVALNPQTLPLDGSGQRLSPHDPLLPVLLAPAMGLGGWVAAKVTLAVLGATAAAVTLWTAIRRFQVTPAVAALVVTGLFCAPPLTSYATQVYPEMPAALAVVTGLALLTRPASSGRPVAVDAGLLAVVVALPWLSVKYVPVASLLALWALLHHLAAGRRRRSVGLCAVLALAGLVYLIVHQRVYGGWTVYAAGDHFVDGELLVVGDQPDYMGRSRRLIGLLVDRTFGLVPWAPAYLLAAPALVALVRRRTPGWGVVVSVTAAGWGVATWVALTMHGWWWPGRQLVVVLPLVVVAIAGLVDRHRRALLPALVVASVLATGSWLWLVVEASTGRRTLIVDFMETAGPWYRMWSMVFPDHLGPGPVDLVATSVWVVAVAVSAWVAWWAEGAASADGRDASSTGGPTRRPVTSGVATPELG
jgi:hypothetical protein